MAGFCGTINRMSATDQSFCDEEKQMRYDSCYVAIWEDRHADTSVKVFSEQDTAIEWAQSKVRECDRHGELDETITESMLNAGWLYYGCYSCEGDNIRVVECKVDEQ